MYAETIDDRLYWSIISDPKTTPFICKHLISKIISFIIFTLVGDGGDRPQKNKLRYSPNSILHLYARKDIMFLFFGVLFIFVFAIEKYLRDHVDLYFCVKELFSSYLLS